MDGVMFMHHSRLSRMRAILNDASMIAGVRMVTTAFSFQGAATFFTISLALCSETTVVVGDEHFFRPTTGNIRVNRCDCPYILSTTTNCPAPRSLTSKQKS